MRKQKKFITTSCGKNLGVILLDLPFLPTLSQEVCSILCATVQLHIKDSHPLKQAKLSKKQGLYLHGICALTQLLLCLLITVFSSDLKV